MVVAVVAIAARQLRTVPVRFHRSVAKVCMCRSRAKDMRMDKSINKTPSFDKSGNEDDSGTSTSLYNSEAGKDGAGTQTFHYPLGISRKSYQGSY